MGYVTITISGTPEKNYSDEVRVYCEPASAYGQAAKLAALTHCVVSIEYAARVWITIKGAALRARAWTDFYELPSAEDALGREDYAVWKLMMTNCRPAAQKFDLL